MINYVHINNINQEMNVIIQKCLQFINWNTIHEHNVNEMVFEKFSNLVNWTAIVKSDLWKNKLSDSFRYRNSKYIISTWIKDHKINIFKIKKFVTEKLKLAITIGEEDIAKEHFKHYHFEITTIKYNYCESFINAHYNETYDSLLDYFRSTNNKCDMCKYWLEGVAMMEEMRNEIEEWREMEDYWQNCQCFMCVGEVEDESDSLTIIDIKELNAAKIQKNQIKTQKFKIQTKISKVKLVKEKSLKFRLKSKSKEKKSKLLKNYV